MINFGSLRNMDKEKYDRNIMIVQYAKDIPDYAERQSLLSPHYKNFQIVKLLKEANQLNVQSFDEYFVPNFIKQLKAYNAISLIDAYIEEFQEKDAVFVCYCSNLELCHRKVILGLFQGRAKELGKDVYNKLFIEEYPDYSYMYDEYKR